MAGRFLFQSLSSRISSRNLLRVESHASASGVAAPVCRVAEGGIGILRSFVHGSAAHHSTPIPSIGAVHRYEGRIGTLSNVLRGASVRPSTASPANSGVHGYAVRYFNTLPWTYPAAKTSSPTNSMASVFAHHVKPAFVDSAGVKPTFSSNSPTKSTVTLEAKHTACEAETEAKKSAFEYRSPSKAEWEARNKAITDNFKARKTRFDKDADEFSSFMTRLVLAWTLIGAGFVVESSRRYHGKRKSSEIAAAQWQKLWNNCE